MLMGQQESAEPLVVQKTNIKVDAMKNVTKSVLACAALLMSAPAFADDGSGRPVPGLGPGGAGATEAALGDPGYAWVNRDPTGTVAPYRLGLGTLLQRYGSPAGNRPAE
jgi:hypothetical protein